MKQATLFFISALLLTACNKGTPSNNLTQDEVKAIIINHTEVGIYTNKGKELNYAEFYRADGKIMATEDLYGPYVGTYEIKPDGCFNADYDGDTFDGCYYYQKVKDNQYQITSPAGTTSTITILDGDPKMLSK